MPSQQSDWQVTLTDTKPVRSQHVSSAIISTSRFVRSSFDFNTDRITSSSVSRSIVWDRQSHGTERRPQRTENKTRIPRGTSKIRLGESASSLSSSCGRDARSRASKSVYYRLFDWVDQWKVTTRRAVRNGGPKRKERSSAKRVRDRWVPGERESTNCGEVFHGFTRAGLAEGGPLIRRATAAAIENSR